MTCIDATEMNMIAKRCRKSSPWLAPDVSRLITRVRELEGALREIDGRNDANSWCDKCDRWVRPKRHCSACECWCPHCSEDVWEGNEGRYMDIADQALKGGHDE